MNDVPQQMADAAASGELVLVVGSGVSIQATKAPCASWRGLLQHGMEFARRHGSLEADATLHGLLSSTNPDYLLAAAHVLGEALQRCGRFQQWLDESVGSLRRSPHDELLPAIAAVGATVVTTNYDDLLSEALGLPPVTWRDRSLVNTARTRGLIHMHGHYSNADSVVLDPRSYERVVTNEAVNAIWKAFDTLKTIVFVGCGDGLNDPHFRTLFDWATRTLAGANHRHYVLCLDDDCGHLAPRMSPRLTLVPYGRHFGELAGYLRRLAACRPRAPRPVPATRAAPAAGYCFGRSTERADLATSLLHPSSARVVILGAGGVGKTTLALKAMEDPAVVERFSQRVFVRCDAALNRGSLVLAIAAALGLIHSDELTDAVIEYLRQTPSVLLLDGLEVPWDNDRTNVEAFLALLDGIPELRLLATLRGTVACGRVAWTLRIDTRPLDTDAAQEMFLAIAGPQFAADPLLSSFIGAVKRLPLAIHVLAHLAQQEYTLEPMWWRWQSERGGMLYRPQQKDDKDNDLYASLRLSLSSPRMTDGARRLLHLLAFLPDGMQAADVSAVMPDGAAAAAVLRGLGLLEQDARRVRLFALLRDYARSTLPDEALWGAATRHYLALAKRGDDLGFQNAANSLAATIAAEASTIEVILIHALRWSDPPTVADAAVAYGRFIRYTGVGSPAVVESIATDLALEPRLRARCLRILADLSLSRGDVGAARRDCEAALELAIEAGDARGEAECRRQFGSITQATGTTQRVRESQRERRRAYKLLGAAGTAFERTEPKQDRELPADATAIDYDEAERYYEDALEIFRRIGDLQGIANCLRSLADVALGRRALERAKQLYSAARAQFHEIESTAGEATCVKSLGHLAYKLNDVEEAERLYREALPMYRQVGYSLGEGNCLRGLGKIAARRGDAAAERHWLKQARELYKRSRATRDEARCVFKIAASYLDHGSRQEAIAMYAETIPLYELLGDTTAVSDVREILVALTRTDAPS